MLKRSLPILWLFLLSTAAAAFDLNSDGWEDLVISNYEDGKGYNLNSYILWGGPEFDFLRRTELETHGARGVSVADLNADGQLEIIFCNFTNGQNRKIDSYIYWGGDPTYQRRTGLPTVSAYGCSVADLDGDSRLDLVFSNYSDGDNAAIHSYVYWGDADFRFARKTELATHGALGHAVADLDRDGHPDLVFCSQNIETTSAPSYIYWGSDAHDFSKRTEIPTRYPYDVSAADLDNDGHLDLVFSDFSPGPSCIFWGNSNALFQEKTELPTRYATANSVADLDADGHPDLVFSCYKNERDSHDVHSLILWGDGNRRFAEKTELKTRGAHGNTVADLNRDGNLDIVFSNHHAPKSVIYWGDGGRTFKKSSEIPSIGPTGVCAGENSAYGQNLPTQT